MHEGKTYRLIDQEFKEYHGITMVGMVMNEEKNIVDFLKHIRPVVDKIVLIDGGSNDKTVELAIPLVDCLKVIPFKGHHANQKNRAIELSHTDWTLLMDADEKLSDKLAKEFRGMIEQDEYDCYSFPRREYRDGKEDNSVYPDYQDRLFRTYCRLVRPIHHELVGYRKKKKIPENSGMDIIHSKSEEKHKSRNTSYSFFERHYKYEIGSPGAQLEESFSKKYPQLAEHLTADGSISSANNGS